MNIITSLQEWRCLRQKLADQIPGFVPTMGNLHAGHLHLCQKAAAVYDITVAAFSLTPRNLTKSMIMKIKPSSVKVLEGAYRPDHFTGMFTIVLKLLNIIRPTHAYFGKKIYQQFLLVKKNAGSIAFCRSQLLAIRLSGLKTD
jgi:pantoate--beta-alanine ligase